MTFQDGIYWAVRARLQGVCFVVVYGGPRGRGAGGQQALRQTLKPDKCLVLWFSDAFKVSVKLKACLCVYARLKAYTCPLPHLFLSLCSTKAHADSSKYKQTDFRYNQ